MNQIKSYHIFTSLTLLMALSGCYPNKNPQDQALTSEVKELANQKKFEIDKSSIRDTNIIVKGETYTFKQMTLVNHDTSDYFLCTSKSGILHIGFFEAIDSLGTPMHNFSDYDGCVFAKLSAKGSIPLLINNRRMYRIFEPTIELYTDTLELTKIFFQDSLTF